MVGLYNLFIFFYLEKFNILKFLLLLDLVIYVLEFHHLSPLLSLKNLLNIMKLVYYKVIYKFGNAYQKVVKVHCVYWRCGDYWISKLLDYLPSNTTWGKLSKMKLELPRRDLKLNSQHCYSVLYCRVMMTPTKM